MVKFQDLVFLLVFVTICLIRDWKLATIIGLVALLFAVPLFKLWIFFTAERLTWYSAAFILLAIVLLAIKKNK